jgi:hypothetical protein
MAIVDGWGRGTWGEGSWGENIPVILVSDESTRLVSEQGSVNINADGLVILTGEDLSLSLNSVLAKIDSTLLLSGEQLTLDLDSVFASVSDIVSLDSFQLNGVVGELDAGPDVSISGIQLPMYIGDVTFQITGSLNLTGQQLSTQLNSVTPSITIDVFPTGEDLSLTLGSVTTSVSANINLTGEQLETNLLPSVSTTLHDSMTASDTSAFLNDVSLFNKFTSSGVVRINNEYMSYTSTYIYQFDNTVFVLDGLTRGLYGTTPDTHSIGATVTSDSSAITVLLNTPVNLTGQQLTGQLGSLDPSPDVELTGQDLTSTLGSVTAVPGQLVPLTGINLTSSIGNIIVSANANVLLTGQTLTTNIGSLKFVIWSRVDTGISVDWTEVDTAA